MSDYCERSDVEDVLGAANTAQYADLDNDENPTTIANRIARAIAVATAEIDDVARAGGYQTPLHNTAGVVPVTVENLCAVLAALWLYEARGTQADPRSGQPVHQYSFRAAWARRVLDEILTGKRRLDAGRG